MYEKELVQLLKEKNYHISFAESITGGLCASTLINISGASDVIKESLIVYSNEAKIKYLNVNNETIKKYNVVSKEVAEEMANGLRNTSGSDICVATTGVAGPDDVDGIKAGTVCFGFYFKDKIITEEVHFENEGRNIVRDRARDYAFRRAVEMLNE